MKAEGKVMKKRGEGVSDGAYLEWIADLKRRYRRTQIKAAVAVNSAMLEFYWSLGKDISGKYPGKKRNLGFFDNLSSDLCLGIKNPVGLSASNLRYAYRFFELYSLVPQVVEDNVDGSYLQQLAEDNGVADLMKIPWGHHIVIIDKSKGDCRASGARQRRRREMKAEGKTMKAINWRNVRRHGGDFGIICGKRGDCCN
jgi:hypothetical protein